MSGLIPRLMLPLAWTLFGLGCVAWTFVEPYRPERMIRALPAGTMLFTTHENAAQRWRAMAAHPVVAAIAEASGQDGNRFQRKLNDPDLQTWVQRLAGVRTHFAYSFAHGRLAEPAWIGVSWVGGKAAFFRLWLAWIGIRDYTFVGRHHGRSIWEIGAPKNAQDPHLHICLAEGMLVAVLSRDPGSILSTLDGLDGLAPTLQNDRTGRRAELKRWAGEAQDYGYHFLRNMQEYGPAFFRIDQMNATGFHGSARLLWPYPGGGVLSAKAGDLATLLGDLPQALAALPPRTLSQVITQAPSLPILDEFAGMILTNAMPFASLAVVDGEYGGSHRGVRVPLALAALPMESEAAALAAAQGFVTDVNARVPVGWVIEPAGTNTLHRLFAFTGTVKSKYSKWEGDDRAGFAVWNNWLVLTTHVGGLRRLLERTTSPEAVFEATRARWRETVGQTSPGCFFLRADRLGRTIGSWAQAYALRLQLKDKTKFAAWAPGLDTAEKWASALGTLGEIRGRLTEENPWLQVDITGGATP